MKNLRTLNVYRNQLHLFNSTNIVFFVLQTFYFFAQQFIYFLVELLVLLMVYREMH
jgi:hypothetical protein